MFIELFRDLFLFVAEVANHARRGEFEDGFVCVKYTVEDLVLVSAVGFGNIRVISRLKKERKEGLEANLN